MIENHNHCWICEDVIPIKKGICAKRKCIVEAKRRREKMACMHKRAQALVDNPLTVGVEEIK